MRLVKLAIISVIILFAIATAIGLLLPKQVVVSRASDIVAPKDSLLKLVSSIQQWKVWVQGMDSKNVKIFSDKTADLNGTKVEITLVENGEVHSLWHGKKGTTQESIIRVIQDSSSGKAVVQWQFTEHLKWYPWQRFGSMMNEAMIGSLIEQNLANLKKIAER